MAAVFSAGGLASGMDTNSIIDQLVALEKRPLDQLTKRQTGMRTQISALADIMSSLTSLQSAAKDLGDNGVYAAKVTSSNTAFSATPGTGASPGRYSVEVLGLAKASKWRSAGFTGSAGMAGGSLQLTVQGKTYDPITVADGATLADVASAIRASGAPLSATVLSDGTSSYLSITARDTGFPLDQTAAAALSIGFTPSNGATGQAPGFAELDPAANASFKVDGLTFTRTSNTVTDAVPGITFNLAKGPSPAEDLVLSTDQDGTKARLQKFVNAYNAVNTLVQRQLNVTKDTDRSSTLAGDPSIRMLQSRLHAMVVTQVSGLGNVRTLADVGVKTARDGSISIDDTTLQSALARDPSAVNSLFSTANAGLSSVVDTLVKTETRSGDGILVARQAGLNASITELDKETAAMQRRLDAYRANLQAQFTAMENAVSGYKSIGTFLTNQDNAKKSS